MTKKFSKNNPLDKLSDTSKNTQEQPSEKIEPEPQAAALEPGSTQPVKRKAGRPKTRDVKNTCKNINVAVPIALLDQWEEIKIVHGSNLTGYITKLIEKDMNANYERYRDIADSLKDI